MDTKLTLYSNFSTENTSQAKIKYFLLTFTKNQIELVQLFISVLQLFSAFDCQHAAVTAVAGILFTEVV